MFALRSNNEEVVPCVPNKIKVLKVLLAGLIQIYNGWQARIQVLGLVSTIFIQIYENSIIITIWEFQDLAK